MNNLTRKDFLNKLGLGAAFVLTSTCLQSCSKDMADVPAEIDFTVDLDNSEYDNLLSPEGWVVVNAVVVAQGLNGEYLAATVVCSDAGNPRVEYRDGEWFCPVHGARFTLDGEGLNARGSAGLTNYNTKLIAPTILRVFS